LGKLSNSSFFAVQLANRQPNGRERTGLAVRRLKSLVPLVCLALLGGCKAVVLDPSGDVAIQQRDALLDSVWLMLLVIVPVMALTVWFAWHFRESNKNADYQPEWDHSTQLELIIWGAPLLIIIALGAVTWMGTHLLDPYRPIDRISADKNLPASAKPIDIDVVALDWKWLFIYPQYGIATLNGVAVPVDRQVAFHITSSSVMNAFYVPAMAGMIYAMPGMETQLHAVMNKTGIYEGFSANYSGDGFAGMHFNLASYSEGDFDKWVAQVKSGGGALDRDGYLQLEQPSQNLPPRTYGTVDPSLFKLAVNQCVEPGKMCLDEMMAIDMKGGLGLAGVNNVWRLVYDKNGRPGTGPTRAYVAALCRRSATATSSTPLTRQAPLRLSPVQESNAE
jgi:cytochrome o ubiquinol oxidase subunit II